MGKHTLIIGTDGGVLASPPFSEHIQDVLNHVLRNRVVTFSTKKGEIGRSARRRIDRTASQIQAVEVSRFFIGRTLGYLTDIFQILNTFSEATLVPIPLVPGRPETLAYEVHERPPGLVWRVDCYNRHEDAAQHLDDVHYPTQRASSNANDKGAVVRQMPESQQELRICQADGIVPRHLVVRQRERGVRHDEVVPLPRQVPCAYRQRAKYRTERGRTY